MNKTATYTFLALVVCTRLYGADLKCVGVLGNSGEKGDTIIRFSEKRDPQGRSGIGIALDEHHTIWSRAGQDRVNRYALDGRFLASYSIPPQSDHADMLSGVGRNVILRLRSKLYRFSIDAEPGTSATPMNIECSIIGFTEQPKRFPMIDKAKKLFLVNPESGDKEEVMTFKDKAPHFLFLTADGTIHATIDSKMRQIKDGQLVPNDDPPKVPGGLPQLIDGYWYGYTWHGTIKRFDNNFSPAPGIVLGGSSGSFIGRLDENAEISNPRGLCKLSEELYAVGGFNGTVHLLQWLPGENRFEIIRRIGSMHMVKGTLAVDDKGRVMVPNGNWEWADGPDTPLRHGVGFRGDGQAVVLESGAVVSGSIIYGREPSMTWGSMDKERKSIHDKEKKFKLRKGNSGMVVLKKERRNIACIINPKGEGQRIFINSDGAPREYLGLFKLETTSPVKRWTTMAKVSDHKVLVAGDGHVIEFDATSETVWKETGRWNSWGEGPEERFGDMIHISSDRKRLWVSDTTRHRVLCFAREGRQFIASFGRMDEPGDDLASMTGPTTVSGRSGRAVVHDHGNQRILKFELKP